jgi:hypothetical protein
MASLKDRIERKTKTKASITFHGFIAMASLKDRIERRTS